MSLLTVGVFGTSRKKQEKRVPIHPDQLDWIDPEVRSHLFFEEGYGLPFGIDDTKLAALSGGVLIRAELFQRCDIALLAKPVQEDFDDMKEGTIHWGWPHCVQQRRITQTAIDRKLTLIAWEAMHRWSAHGDWQMHVFQNNNEIAGYAGIQHAMNLIGIDGNYGPNRKAVVLSFGSVSRGAIDLIWWQVFGGLYSEFIQSSKFILNKPHSRIIRKVKYVKADKLIKWSTTLEEEYSQFKYLPNKNYRSEYKTLSTNTSENRFFKHAVFQTLRRYKKVKSFIERRFTNSITSSFKNELNSIEKQLETISVNPFFRSIDDFHGIKQESLVLQKATGYSTIYKSWIMLNSGLKFLDGIQKIELKNIAELYQIWCFLEIKNVLQKLLDKDKPDEVDLAEIQIDDFVFKIERGVKSKVSFNKANGDIINLFHDFSYNTSHKQPVKSFTVNQRPDIVLRISKSDLKENYVLTYLYDAKYRLVSDDKEGSPDLPTEDSINQMHRYRDAIYYVNKDKVKPEKEVIGGYIIFPGSGDIETIKNLDYYKSIESVNIGAFPLRPNDNTARSLLEEHLRAIIGLDTESILNDVSTQKELEYENVNPEVLIGIVTNPNHKNYFEKGEAMIYHTGLRKPSRFGYKDLKYFSPYIQGKGCKHYYEIKDYSILPRNKVYEKEHLLFDSDTSERLVLHLGNQFVIKDGKYYKVEDGISVYRYTKLSYLKNLNNEVIMATKKYNYQLKIF